MNILTQELITGLQSVTYQYTTTVTRTYDEKNKSFPIIIVSQMDDETLVNTAAGEKISQITFSIDIFAKDTLNLTTTNIDNRMKVCDSLAQSVDTYLTSTFGLVRVSSGEFYNYSTTIGARSLVYTGYIMNGYIYGNLPY